MNPYKINKEAIREFINYHGLKSMKDVAEQLHISQPYLSQLLAGTRRLNEEVRLRLQIITRLPQDKLFIPDFDALPFTHQSLAMGKYYGIMPYSEGSLAKIEREPEKTPDLNPNWKEEKQEELRKAGYTKFHENKKRFGD